MRKTDKRTRPACGKRIALIVLLLAVIAAIAAAVVLLTRQEAQQGNPQEPVSVPIEILPDRQNMYAAKSPQEVEKERISGFTDLELAPTGKLENGLTITRVGTYSGCFVEDGSDREVSDVLAIVVTNNGDHFVEYAQIVLSGENESALFSLTSLPVGQSVLVMEKSALAYQDGLCFDQAVLQTFTAPDKDFSLYPEVFSIKAADGVVNLMNNTAESYGGAVAIYYKNVENGIYIGGITYSKSLTSGIPAGGIAQFVAEHYSVAGSELVFIVYEH